MHVAIENSSSVTFRSLSGVPAPDGFVFREAPKVFQVGDYPDKKFDFSAEDARRAVAGFQPVEIDLEHQSTVFDGKLGKLVDVSLESDGVTLSGIVQIPTWLDDVLKGEPIPVSLEFDRKTKQIVRMALTVEPRVRDAAIAAFNRGASSPIKESTMSKLKDLRDKVLALFSGFEAGEGDNATTPDPAADSNPAAAPGAAAAPNPLPSPENTASKTETPAENPTFNAKFAALQNELAQSRAAIATLESERRNSAASNFADEVVRQGRAYPAERAAIVAQFCAAWDDDATNPKTVQFGANPNEKGTRLDALRAAFAARPENPLTREQIAATGELIFSGKSSSPVNGGEEKTAGMSEERKSRLLMYTSAGRALMAEKGGKAKC